MGHPITTDEMDTAIEGQDARINRDDLDDLLQAIQEDIEDFWSEHMGAVEGGKIELVAEGDIALVFADLNGKFWQSQFDALADYINLLGIEVDGIAETVIAAHHNAAYRLADHNWSTTNPIVVGKTIEFNGTQLFVEAIVNSLMARGLSPGQSWAYYGVIIRGTSRNKWAQRCGYSDHSAVSEAVRKAQKKLGRV